MPYTAKLFMIGSDQAVDLPDEFRFEGDTVYIRKDAATGDVILSRMPTMLKATQTPLAYRLTRELSNDSGD